MRLDPVANRVPGNESLAAHVKYVFEEVVGGEVGSGAAIDVVGVGAGADEALGYLDREWGRWGARVLAVVVGAPQTWASEYTSEAFREFLGKVSDRRLCGGGLERRGGAAGCSWLIGSQRGRAYLLSKEPLDTPLPGRAEYGCNCYSAGEPLYTECILPVAKESFLRYFDIVAKVPSYEEVEVLVPDLEGMAPPA